MSSISKKSDSEGRVLIGPAGWSYPDWEGVVYPKPVPREFHPLQMIAEWFDIAEINNSFYRIPTPGNAQSWVQKISNYPDFQFSAKLYQGFTHDRRWSAGDVQAYQNFLKPLVESGRLAAVLIQFPWSFKGSRDNLDYARKLFDTFRDYPLAMEVRHASWWKEKYFEAMREAGISLANIDQPALRGNVLPDDVLTGPLAYVRFHGRNADAWWKKEEAYNGERYDYLYNDVEIQEWGERLKRMGQSAKSTIVIMNNHHRGDAVVNGMEIATLFHQQKGRIPETLARAYPEAVKNIDLPIEEKKGQMDMFGE